MCGMLERLVRAKTYPIVFDKVAGDYHLRDGKNAQLVLYHCFWCGGTLPSKRAELFMTPDEAEIAEADQLLADTESIDQVIAVLGPPDQSYDASEFELPLRRMMEKPQKKQKANHRYANRWSTLILEIIEYADGSICRCYVGQPKR